MEASMEGGWALVIGEPDQGELRARPAELLKEVVGEIRSFPTPGDALDAFCLDGSDLRTTSLILLVVDQRGKGEISWTWLSLFAHLGLGPVILLVDEVNSEIERRARATGVRHCLEESHLARHHGLLVRVAQRVLEGTRDLVPVGAAV